MKARIFVPDQKDREIPVPPKLPKSGEKLMSNIKTEHWGTQK
jgi:hypothetical protein